MTRAMDALTKWHGEVQAAAIAFEGRWTMAALKRVDPDLAQRLDEQCGLFVEMCVTMEAAEIAEHGAATIRGYAAAVAAMEASGEDHDAYWLGKCPSTGTRVAVGQKNASAGIVRARYGAEVLFMTPDEVAMLVGLKSDDVAKRAAMEFVAEAKRTWPGATLDHITTGGEA